jgi:uncharacterized integral membrane protein (TIGR00697 family)
MPNELLWFLFLIVDFSMALIAIYFFGRKALFVIIAVDIVVCNIQVLKTIEIFGMVATLGNILYGSIFLATDLLGEAFGKKEAQRGVWLGFFALLFMTISMQFALLFKPDQSDFIHQSLKNIFGLVPRVAFASLIAYLTSQFHDVWAFHFWRDKTRGKHLWLRNNASTWISQAIDSVVFVLIAFYGVFETTILISILLTTYFIKVIVAFMDTPVIYLGRWVLNKHNETFGQDSKGETSTNES